MITSAYEYHIGLLSQVFSPAKLVVRGIEDLDALLTAHFLHRFQNGILVRCRAAIPVVDNLVGIGPYNCDFLHLICINRQCLLVVLQQHNALGCHLANELLHVVPLIGRHCRRVLADRCIRTLTVEQAKLQGDIDITFDNIVDLGLGHQSLLYRFLQIRLIAIQELTGSRLDHTGSSRGEIGIIMMSVHQKSISTAIGTDNAVVTPLLAGNLVQAGMYRHRDAVPAVIRSHKSPATALGDTFIKRIGIVFTEQPLIEIARRRVTSVFIAVGQEMLHQRCGLPVSGIVALQTLHHGDGELSYQIGILTIAFLGTSPTRITRQIGIRCKHDETLAAGDITLGIPSHLLGLYLTDTTDERAVPRTTHTIGLRENGGGQVVWHLLAIDGLHAIVARRTSEGQSVQAFVTAGDRNTQARRTKHGR